MTVTTLRKLSAAQMTTTDHIVNVISTSAADMDHELTELCRSLPPEKQHQAAKLLRTFFEALGNE